MREHIGKDAKLNEVRLLIPHPSFKDNVILILEGNSDIRLFRSLVNHQQVRLDTFDGKVVLLEVVEILSKEFPKRVLGICDADFDHLNEINHSDICDAILVTDHHDAEIMMLDSPALQAFIDEYSSVENSAYVKQVLLENCLEAAYQLGMLRWANNLSLLNLNFKGLNFGQLFDIENLIIGVHLQAVIDELFLRSDNIPEGTEKDHVKGLVQDLEARTADHLQVCNGHDVTNLIACVFRQRWASIETNMDSKKVESCLRLAYSLEFFAKTRLYRDLKTLLAQFGLEYPEPMPAT